LGHGISRLKPVSLGKMTLKRYFKRYLRVPLSRCIHAKGHTINLVSPYKTGFIDKELQINLGIRLKNLYSLRSGI